MSRFSASSLRVRLLSVVLLALLPALGFAFFTAREQRKLAALEVQEGELRLARWVAEEQGAALEAAREVLILLAQLPEVRGRDAAACGTLLARLHARFSRYANLGVIGPDGVLRCSALPADGRVDLSDRAYFRRALATRDLAVGEYQIGRVTGVASINFGYPVLDADGPVLAVVYAALDLDWVSELAARADLPEGGTLTLVDAHGKVLARHPDAEPWIGRSIGGHPAWAALQRGRHEGTAEGAGLDGEERLFAFTRLRGSATGGDLFLIVSVPTRVAFASVNRILTPNLAALAFFAVLAALAAGLGAHRLVLRPVGALLEATRRLAAGELGARSEVAEAGGELGQLARSFDTMAERLEASIREHEQAEDELREANETLRALIEASPLTVVALDRAGRVVTWNRAAERMFGWSEAEARGRPPPFVTDDRREEYQGLVARVLRGESLTGVEVRRQKRDGAPVDARIWAGPLRDPRGEIHGIIALVEDVTEWKSLEHQLRQSQKMEAIGRLAGGIAHDFNNLLTAMLGHSDLMIQELEPGDPHRADAEEIKGAAERAAALTRQLLAFSRQQILEPRVLDLNEVVARMDKLLRRLIGEDVELVTVLAPELGRVRADPGQMEQVIMNLAVNARDAMPEGGTLTIETADVELDEAYARQHVTVVPGPYVMLAVTDTGVGMDAETQSQIFEPFFTTKDLGHGTGLGLSTVYGIVKQSEGNIWVYSEPGHGTTFKIYLPRVEVATEPEPESAATPAGALPRGSETVLVVEDEDAVRRLVSRVLAGCGYRVLQAADADEALRRADELADAIQLLVTDLVMPEMGGRELADRLRAIRPGLRVLYMSGYTDRGASRQRGFEPGAAFLEKPFTPQALAAKVRAALDAA